MHPDDRVLVAVMNRPQDLENARDKGWYRLPESKAGRGAFFEYIAFYFTSGLAEHKWAVHYYARNLGHELVTRRQLLPDEPHHPRADQRYYKLLLGPLHRREPPIPSLRWRRITFIHTTWDRFQAAEEINDLFVEGDQFVDRLYHALRDANLAPERHYPVRESGVEYVVDLALPCRRGILAVTIGTDAPALASGLSLAPETMGQDPFACVDIIREKVGEKGGLQPPPGSSNGI
jgi:hypothetical protein